MYNKAAYKNYIFRIIHIIWILFGIFISVLFISEWIKIGILGKAEGYYFGTEAQNPYYYKSSFFYSLVCFIEGALLASVTLTGLMFFLKGKWQKLKVTSLIQLAIILAQILNARIMI